MKNHYSIIVESNQLILKPHKRYLTPYSFTRLEVEKLLNLCIVAQGHLCRPNPPFAAFTTGVTGLSTFLLMRNGQREYKSDQ